MAAALWLGVLVLVAEPAAAQESRIVTIVNADSVSGEVVDGQRLRTLLGRVHLRQDSTDLRARRAVQFLDRDEILFEGAVEIADGADTLNAREVAYNSATRVGNAVGDVRLADAEAELFSRTVTYFRTARRAEFDEPVRLVERDGGAVLTSERGTYRTDTKEALFEGDVQLVDSTSTLTSRRGRYGTEDHRADFFGDVRLVRPPDTRLDADSLTHFRDTEVSYASGNVRIERFGGDEEAEAADSTRRTLLFGGTAFHDARARFSRVERDPLLVRLQTDPTGVTDTLLVRAVVLEASQPDSLGARALPAGATLQRLVARRDVRLYGPQLAAVADSAVFDRVEFEPADSLAAAPPVEDVIRLLRDPVAWMHPRGSAVFTEVSGDTIRVSARGEAIDSVHVTGRAFTARPDSALGRINQIRGRRLLALFAQDSLRWIKVWPNAEAVYFRASDAGALEGAVRFSADSLAFRFRGDDLRDVRGVRGVEGTYYDAGLIPAPLRLDGFRYAPERRPTRLGLLGDAPLRDLPPAPDDPAPAAPPPVDEPLREDEPPLGTDAPAGIFPP